MEAQLTETGTYPAQDYASSFVATLPTDSRFLQVSYQKIMPTSSIDGRTIEFNLEKFQAANIYQIQDTLLEVRIQIVTPSGTVPAKTAKVAPINNVLHSLFERVRLFINNFCVTVSADSYPYKAYISNLLTYPFSSKTTHLVTHGWFADDKGEFDNANDLENSGFKDRLEFFRKNYSSSNDFRTEGALFIGRLFHELVSCETGLPPNVSAKFQLDRADSSFVLICPVSDTTKYEVKISHICLYVPVAQLALPLYNELSSILTKKPIAIHFRRIEIRPISLPPGKQEYYTSSLFSGSDIPCRIIVCFVESKSKLGSYHKNPFYFRRYWEVEETSQLQNYQFRTNWSDDHLEERFKRIEEQFQKFTERFCQQFDDSSSSEKTKGKGKGKGRGKRSQPLASEEAINTEASKRLRDFVNSSELNLLQSQIQSTSTAATSQMQTRLSVHSSAPSSSTSDIYHSILQDDPTPVKAKKKIFLKRVECQLNSTPIDQISENQTEDECSAAYWRMFSVCGQANSLFSNSINYDEFREGYYFSMFDLSTSSRSGNNFVVPSIRVGHVRLRVELSQPLPIDLCMMVYCGFPSTLFIDGETVTTSYTPR